MRQGHWREFDLDTRTWTIPAERMKMRRGHKKPLSTAVISELRKLHQITGRRSLLFPLIKSPQKPLSDNTLNAAVRRISIGGGQMTSHGFRASASSFLNESGRWSPDAIEAELAYVGSNQIRNAYHRAQYWDERKEMTEWWGNRIQEALKAGE
ncbi:MAG: site-specific integrase [Pseudomonadota bacterium]